MSQIKAGEGWFNKASAWFVDVRGPAASIHLISPYRLNGRDSAHVGLANQIVGLSLANDTL